ncbi:phosphate ABC transporter permease subunit PstC [Phascolarctobacterium succinatutens]|uniref:phosphate ABC transporter permease subunit PstC n=1 Tax=Phascolarctobacterium succinatutens TaxID=626940 RepID=UPI0026EF6F5E|nr:phosphate ABC transporter permease subunit PstC [Phascolarctobacterium succinatutens]
MQQVTTNAYRQDALWRYIITGCGLALIVLTLSIGAFLCYKGVGTFTTYNHSIAEFLFSADWAPSDSAEGGGSVGAAIFIFGSVITCALALAIATPFSLATAIFMTEISPELGKRFVQPAVEIFVGIPSVVYGWIGLTILVPLIKNIFNLRFGFSVLAAGIVLAVMIFPTITSLAADALRSIPKSYRAASYGLGATRWQTIAKVVVPAAVTGLMTAVILGLARAFGEALAVAMVIGKMRAFPTSLLSPTNNLTAAIAADMGGAMEGSEYNIALWTMALLLFIISLTCIFAIHFLTAKGGKQA